MNLGFKRITSSILAFVMMFSTLVVANVASVSAASTDFYLTADDLNSGLTTGTSRQSNIVLSENAINAGLTISKNGNGYYQEYGARADGSKNLTNATGKEFTTEYRPNSERSLSFTPASNGKLNVYVYTDKNDRTLTIGGISNTVSGSEPYVVKIVSQDVTANQEVTITTSTNIVILAIEYVSSSATYSWALDTNSLNSVTAANVSIDTSAAGATNTLSYNGTDYVVKEAN
ncbi:MAG: hypothetical protein Q4F63_08925, partial [Clostridia bacterium]|nr:hypothetical protein [Clostridia bacterium]